MDDKEYYAQLDATLKELMYGVRHIVCDIGRLNEVLIETSKRKERTSEEGGAK